MSFSQGLRWSGKGISNGRQRLLLGRHNVRNYSLHASRRPIARPKDIQVVSSFSQSNSTQQYRSFSLFGWGSVKKGSEEGITSQPLNTSSSTSSIDESVRAVKASHATSDTPDHSIFSAQPVSAIEPEPLQAIEAAITRPHGTTPPSEILADTPDLAQIPEAIGYLRDVCGLTYWYGPTSIIQYCIEHVHIWGGLSWGVSIIVVATIARLAILKPAMRASDSAVKLRAIQTELAPLRIQSTEAKAAGDNMKMMRINNEMRAIIKESGASIPAAFLPILLQFPLQFCGYRVLRNAAAVPVPAFETETWLWHTNLALADPWILPGITSAMAYITLKYNMQSGASTFSPQTMKAMIYGLPVLSFAFMHFQPGAVQIFFLTSGVFSMAQSFLIRNPTVRNYFNLAPLPDSTTPGPTNIDPSTIGGLNIRKAKQDIVESHVIAPSPDRSWLDKAVDQVKGGGDDVVKTFSGLKSSVMGTAEENIKKRNKTKLAEQTEKYEYKRRQDLEIEREYRNRSASANPIQMGGDRNSRSNLRGEDEDEVAGLRTSSALANKKRRGIN